MTSTSAGEPFPLGPRALVGLAIALLAASGVHAEPTGLPFPLVVTQVPVRAAAEPVSSDSGSLVRDELGPGERIVVLHPDGEVVVLSEEFVAARDPDVSFDGTRVLFAGKRQADDAWGIWEIHADGKGLRAVTAEPRDCRSPVYLSTLYTITSAEPWYTILYVGVRPELDEHGAKRATSLFSCRLDGSGSQRLTFQLSDDFDPVVMDDGRVLYSSWRYDPTTGGRVELFGINSDGTDCARFAAGAGQRLQQMACTTAAGEVVFVEAGAPTVGGRGRLASVELRRPQRTYRSITADGTALFSWPASLGDGSVLVSRRATAGAASDAIVRLRLADGTVEPVFDAPAFDDIQARPLRPRPLPDGRSSVVDPGRETGKLYCLNVYDGEARLRPHLGAGAVARVRVLEGVLRRGDVPGAARRILGEAPVEVDGSFHLEIPADLPVELQTLDDRGLALATCRWVWVRPGERRGCIGCHEDPELTPENRFVLAVRRSADVLVPSREARRSVGFRDDVYPILRAKCSQAACHGGPESPLRLTASVDGGAADDVAAAYSVLMAPATPGSERPGKYVEPGQARTSYLLWRVLGRDTSRPWDRPSGSPPRKVERMPPVDHAPPLSEAEVRVLVEWIDLGARER